MSEITAEKLRETIITGALSPGQRITEMEIATAMGVSRVVVREAFLMLVREGLIQKERNKYTKVVELTPKDIEDIFDLRIAIEQVAARRCSKNKELIKELSEISERMVEMQREQDRDSIALMYLDRTFHNAIIRCSGNEKLLNVWEEMSGPLLVMLYRYITSDMELNYSHEEIVKALKEGCPSVITNEISHHIEDTKQALLNSGSLFKSRATGETLVS
jgi:DNA-binding GntR family transcriptional regulator